MIIIANLANIRVSRNIVLSRAIFYKIRLINKKHNKSKVRDNSIETLKTSNTLKLLFSDKSRLNFYATNIKRLIISLLISIATSINTLTSTNKKKSIFKLKCYIYNKEAILRRIILIRIRNQKNRSLYNKYSYYTRG